MTAYILACAGLAVLLGATLVRRVLWWALVVVPLLALAVHLAISDSLWALMLFLALAEAVVIAFEVDATNTRRAAGGLPPLTKQQVRARCLGKSTDW